MPEPQSALPTDDATGAPRTVIAGAVLTAAAALEARLRALTQVHDLSVAGYLVLDLLHSQQQALAPRVLSQRLHIPGQTMTRVLDALERAGLAQRLRHPRDRRSTLVALTVAGEQLYHEVCHAILEVERQVATTLAPEEQVTLRTLLRKLEAGLMADEERRET